MYVTKALTTFLCLASVQGYVITIFDGKDCKGVSKRVNVWDNSCRDTNVINTNSFRVEKYGRGHQVADFYPANRCAFEKIISLAADGGSGTFKQGRCLNLSKPARAFGSRGQ
ncbi:hypothetical protein GQ607_001535 [Colletotrichum asianum]|uniref:Uncharacterized protein n=1 Tax=Colletotrichum asianum TaxID=702518 RepID=A0A8H3WSD8_9PEZI|nr:hypothetical protein GQ607_001535 [Colletotrichum asianum]